MKRTILFSVLYLLFVHPVQAVEFQITDYPTGPGPLSAVAADFDGVDGPDLAIVEYAANTVSLRFNDGYGNFSAAGSPLSTKANPIAVTSGDFNHDGWPDLAVTNESLGAGSFSIWLNSGDSVFAARLDYATAISPWAIIAGDFNRDGWPDLALTDHADPGRVMICLNNGNGTFTETGYATGAYPRGLAAADFDADGYPDLAVANGAGTASILLNDGSGGFGAFGSATYPISTNPATSPWAISAGDFSGDGRPDFAVADFATHTLSVFMNDGDGSFASRLDYDTGPEPTGVAAADFDGNIWTDLAVINSGDGSVSVFPNKGDGSGFGPRTDYPAIAGDPEFVLSADLDGRNRADLLVLDHASGVATVLLNASDFQPDPFVFVDQADVSPGSVVVSAPVTITGLTGWSLIAITGGEFSINGGAFSSGFAVVRQDDQVRVRVAAPADYGAASSATVAIGGVIDTFSVWTPVDTLPDPFHFIDQTGVAADSVIVSNEITVNGLSDWVLIEISGGEYSINGGEFTSELGAVTNGDTVRVRLLSSPNHDTTVEAVVSIGEGSDTFSVTTEPVSSGGGGAIDLLLLLAMALVAVPAAGRRKG